MTRKIEGILPIIHTPFSHDDTIDDSSLEREVDWAFEQGIDGCGTGMVSEILRLTSDERQWLTERLVEHVAGRGAVFASVGAESTRQAVLFAQHAEEAGCDAVMAMPPTLNALPPDALVAYYSRLADAVDLPIIVQDASSYVGQAIPIDVYVVLTEVYGPEKFLFKPEAAPLGPNLSAVRDATAGKARIFEGSGGIGLIDAYRRGIAGTMPGVDLLDGIVAIWRALKRGDDEAAYRVALPLGALVNLQLQAGLDGFLEIEKYLLRRRGVIATERRREPFAWGLDYETAAEVDRLFELMMRELEAT